MKASIATTVGALVLNNLDAMASTQYQFSQIPLPYSYDALEPNIDALTMEIHYSKHHAGYLKSLNETISSDKIVITSAEDLFSKISKVNVGIRNKSGGVFNHNLFWQVMTPKSAEMPSGKVAEAINGAFGSFEKFKAEFSDAALTRFGSGWAWLVKEKGQLKIGSTPNQDNPLMDASELKGTPLLCLDVWEHAYYLKYQNKRAEYISNWWKVVNWDEVAKLLK